jgi:hypothetical protein
MCGIAGFIGKEKIDEGRIQETLRRMHRRGPDARGFWNGSAGDVQLLMLHSRLSIIDLDSRSNQPFIHEDYAYWIQLFRHPLVKANYIAFPTTNVLIQASTRSGNKRLALQSQSYVLRNIAGLSAIPAFCCLFTYLFFALYKRGWRTWKEQLIPHRQGR